MSGSAQYIRPYMIRDVADDILTGPIDGVNTVFCTTHIYESGTITLYLNGLKQTAGSGNDYVEGPGGCITMNNPPLPGDVLRADYKRIGV